MPMKVLRVEPYKPPYEKEIDSDLKSMQHEIGGWIQTVYPFEDPVAIICNEEGKLNGMELNRALRDENGEVLAVTNIGIRVQGTGTVTFTVLKEYKKVLRKG